MTKVLMIGILTAILLLLGIFLAIHIKKKKKHKPDYYAFFVMGIIWVGFGIIAQNHVFTAMGLVFALVGITNRDKWKANRRDWKKMDTDEKKLMMVVMIILSLLVIAGLVILVLTQKGCF